MSREQRKSDHIEYALKLGDGPLKNGLENVRFVHNCLPELNAVSVDTTFLLRGISLSSPILINAVTGGTQHVTEINRSLAMTAKMAGVALAVGSQYGAVKTGKHYQSFEVVREIYPEGVIFANISALATPQEAAEAVKMVAAQALQIHLNSTQEIVMAEGDRNFAGYLHNIEKMLNAIDVPVIVKETGCGISQAQIQALRQIGISYFDVGGAGGTNFQLIEGARVGNDDLLLKDWGLTTAETLIEAVNTCSREEYIIATGGIRNAMEVLKCLALGADMVGMAGNVLESVMQRGPEKTAAMIQALQKELAELMLLLGCATTRDLRRVPLCFKRELIDYLVCRGFDVRDLAYARRNKTV